MCIRDRDNSLEKRVELHCHTKMSDMDGVSDVKSIIKRAKKWGMSSIAVTDHGCVQAFPDANHALDKGDTFKILYGVEGYLVDDTKQLVENSKGQTFADTYVVFDIETTGFSPVKNRIIEIGAVKVVDGVITEDVYKRQMFMWFGLGWQKHAQKQVQERLREYIVGRKRRILCLQHD